MITVERKIGSGYPVRITRGDGSVIDVRRTRGASKHGQPFEMSADGIVRGYATPAAAVAAAFKIAERRKSRLAP